jgi:hypothetical protein
MGYIFLEMFQLFLFRILFLSSLLSSLHVVYPNSLFYFLSSF